MRARSWIPAIAGALLLAAPAVAATDATDPAGDSCATADACGRDLTSVGDRVEGGAATFTIGHSAAQCQNPFGSLLTRPSITLMPASATSPEQTTLYLGSISAVSTTADFGWSPEGASGGADNASVTETVSDTQTRVTLSATVIAGLGGLPLKYWVGNSCRDFPSTAVFRTSDVAPDSGLYTLAATADVCDNVTGAQAAVPAGYARVGTGCFRIAIPGTAGPNTLTGNAAANVMRGLGGRDVIRGLGGNDRLFGGPGNDRLTGGPGRDRMLGEAGDDLLDARDGARGDVVNGGPGIDTCRADPGDVVIGCERR